MEWGIELFFLVNSCVNFTFCGQMFLNNDPNKFSTISFYIICITSQSLFFSQTKIKLKSIFHPHLFGLFQCLKQDNVQTGS